MALKSFPRGGRKPQTKPHSSDQLFGKKTRSKPRIKKNKTNENENQGAKKITDLVAISAVCLSYTTLAQGMVVLGRVRESREYDLIVSLPGRLIGRLELTDLSEPYTKLLQSVINSEQSEHEGYRPLPELYKPGDYVVCYIKELNPNQKWRVSLSMEPEFLNRNLDPTKLKKGSKVVCTVASLEEHGYVMTTGIDNLRTFLSAKDVDEGKQYYVGQQISCVVKDAKLTETVTTIKVSAKTKHNASAVAHEAQTLDGLIPGTKLVLMVTDILSNGLQVSFNDNNVGYVNQMYLDKPLSSYENGTELNGTLMYVTPTVKFGYFSLLPEDPEKNTLNEGDILGSGRVMCRERGGILLSLPKGLRGFIPLRRTEVDFEKITTTFVPNSNHKCRILSYDWFDRVYICTMQKALLEQEHFTPTSFTPGDLLDAEISKVDADYGSVSLTIGRTQGYVPPDHVSDIGLKLINKLKVGHSVKVRVLSHDSQRNKVLFTMKQSLVKTNLPILSDINKAEINSWHHGTIVQVKDSGILIQFFGGLKGWVPPRSIGCEISEIRQRYTVGQVVPVIIVKVNRDENKMTVGLVDRKDRQNMKLEIGATVEGTVIESSAQGIQIKLVDSEPGTIVMGFLPAAHMAPSAEIASLLAARFTPGDSITAMVFATKPELILTRTFIAQDKCTDFKKLQVGDYIPCSIKEITKDGLKVLLPIKNHKTYGLVPYNFVTELESLYIHQLLLGKIISIDKKSRDILLTTSLHEVWSDAVKQHADMTTAVDVLNLYLTKVSELSKHDHYAGGSLSKVSLGQSVSGTVDKVTEHGLVLNLGKDLQGTVRKDHCNGNLKPGAKVTGTVLWVNYVHEIVEVTLKPMLANRISTKQRSLSKIPLGSQLRGEIVLITSWFVLVVVKGLGKGRLVALPARRHLNDVQPDLRPYAIGTKVKCYVVLNSDESEILPICVLKSAFETPKIDSAEDRKGSGSKKRKENLSKDEDIAPTKRLKTNGDSAESRASEPKLTNEEKKRQAEERKKRELDEIESEYQQTKTKKQKRGQKNQKARDDDSDNDDGQDEENAAVQREINIKTAITEEKRASIPECGFYWDTTPTPEITTTVESSSDSDEENEPQPKQKKKKLSAAERREQERQKEREIREREEALASNQMPNSADQFNRLVLSSPDSSVVWIQYMVYHLQATEIEKARAVAKRAIKTINFREENEKLNVWQAWLNLESRFGTPDSLNEVFQEAVRTNDAFKVYMHMLTVHADASRQAELERMVITVTGKFKQNPQVWVESGAALLKMSLKDKARHTMQRALQSLPAQQHVDLMVKFAQLENKLGDKERAQTLFEQILSSYPKRVDVWSSYVDSLVKSGDIEIARKVLERATAQSLPARKMKTLFKKFISFEEQHGTQDNVANIQKMALNYIENKCNERTI